MTVAELLTYLITALILTSCHRQS